MVEFNLADQARQRIQNALNAAHGIPPVPYQSGVPASDMAERAREAAMWNSTRPRRVGTPPLRTPYSPSSHTPLEPRVVKFGEIESFRGLSREQLVKITKAIGWGNSDDKRSVEIGTLLGFAQSNCKMLAKGTILQSWTPEIVDSIRRRSNIEIEL